MPSTGGGYTNNMTSDLTWGKNYETMKASVDAEMCALTNRVGVTTNHLSLKTQKTNP